MNIGPSLVCLHTPLFSYLSQLSTAFDKVCGGIFEPNFRILYIFSKFTHHRKSRILGLFFQKLPSRIGDFGISVENGLWEAPLHKRLRPVFFKKILMTLKKVIFLQFFKSQKYVYSGILQLS